MKKTLITTVFSVIFLFGPFCQACRGGVLSGLFAPDKDDMEFVNSAGEVEKFAKAKGARSKGEKSQTPPLVKQAEDFSLYLNPPAPKPNTRTRKTRKGGKPVPKVTRPSSVSAKFKLVGTSYFALQPEKSIALIDQPGKGFSWVRPGGKIGHLVIKEVKDGVVVVQDGGRTYEVEAQRKAHKNLVRGKGPSIDKIVPIKSIQSEADVSQPLDKKLLEAMASLKSTEVAARAKTADPRKGMSQEQKELSEKIFAELEAIATGKNSDRDMKVVEGLLSELEASRIDKDEAKKLGDLGEELKNARQDPNKIKELREKRAQKRKEQIKEAKSRK